MAGEKSPALAAVLNFLITGAGYIYIGKRWVLPGIALVIFDTAINVWALVAVPSSAYSNPAAASAALNVLCLPTCALVIVSILVSVHAYTLAQKHNDTLASAPPPPDPGPCKQCGGSLAYVPLYRMWYCPKCQRYD